LETCLATSPSFYEVFNCKPCVGFQARDVVTGEECDVREGLASASLNDGDIMFAHLVGTTVLEVISPLSFPPEFKRRLVQLARGHGLRGSEPADLREVYFVLAWPGLPKPAARITTLRRIRASCGYAIVVELYIRALPGASVWCSRPVLACWFPFPRGT
jgi:hypothetical protein